MATTFSNLLRLTLLFSVWSIFEKVPYVINMKVQLLDAFFFLNRFMLGHWFPHICAFRMKMWSSTHVHFTKLAKCLNLLHTYLNFLLLGLCEVY